MKRRYVKVTTVGHIVCAYSRKMLMAKVRKVMNDSL